jgi:Phage protein (N4 Gp49/phage Sf6 gene 66) family
VNIGIGIKITRERIESRIDKVRYSIIPDTTTTICAITMINGFVVTSSSACIDPAAFDRKTGEEIAYENALEKIWDLEGYLLKERIYQDGKSNPTRSRIVWIEDAV